MKKITKSTQNKKHDSSGKNFEITGIIMFLFGFFVCLSLFGYKTGIIGDFLVDGFHVLFGISSPIIALVVHTKGSVVQKSMDGMQHSLLQRMLQTGQRAKGICKVKNSAIMQSLGMA